MGKPSKMLIITILIPIIAIILVSTSMAVYVEQINKKAVEQTYETLSDSAESQIIALNVAVNGKISLLTSLSRALTSQKNIGREDMTNRLKAVADTGGFTYLTICGKDGRGLVSNNTNIDLSKTPNVINALETGEPSLIKVHESVIDGGEYMLFTVPVICDNERIGAIVGYYNNQELVRLLRSTAFNNNGYSFVCDSEGNFVIEPEKVTSLDTTKNLFHLFASEEYDLDDAAIARMRSDLKKGAGNIISFANRSGARYAVYMPCYLNNWTLVNVIDQNIANKYAEANKKNGIFVMFVVIACSVIVIVYVLIHEKRRISQLREGRKRELLFYTRDSLTGLYNQQGFEAQAEEFLKDQETRGRFYFIDIDIRYFSAFNMLYGTEKGDDALKSLSCYLSDLFSAPSVCARVYADNFLVLTKGENASKVTEQLEQLCKSVSNALEGSAISIGIYEMDKKNMPLREMMDCAKEARENIKKENNTYIGIYNEFLDNKRKEENEYLLRGDRALTNREFVTYYQPKFDAKTEKPAAAEALVRWRAEDGTLIPPAKFIQLFEQNGLIAKLDYYIFQTVAADMANMKQNGMVVLPVAVNFSKVHFKDPDFVEILEATVNRYHISAGMIEIEFTESAFSDDLELIKEVIGNLKDKGFAVSMDDFGSEYSSLKLLKDVPFDVLKIDRNFLAYEDNKKAEQILKSIFTLAKTLGLTTVMEGVETKEQAELVKQLDCDLIQGFYYAKPLPPEEYKKLLLSN